jgi:hypothetical protein
MVEVARSGTVIANAISPSAISQHQMTIKTIEGGICADDRASESTTQET